MSSDPVDLRQLRIFLAAAELKTFARAAKMIGVTPSAVSQTVATLEKDLGTALFERDARPLRLTAAGRRLAADGAPLINAAAALRERVTSKELAFERLRLGLGESVAATVGPWFVRRMNEKVASLTVYSELSRPLARRLEAGALDVIVCAGPGLEGDAWRRLPAYREDFLLVTAKGVRMPATRNALRELAQTAPFVCYNTESSDQVRVNRILAAADVRPARRIAVASSYGVAGLIAQCTGFGILPPTNLWCGRQFVEGVAFAPLPEMPAAERVMWCVGAVNQPEILEVVRAEAEAVMRDCMMPELAKAAPGLETHVRFGQT